MTMQNNIDIIGRHIWRNMFQPKSQALSLEIDNQRPFGIAVAVSAHDSDSRSDCTQLIQNRSLAHIAQMPDLVRLARKIDNFLRQLVMCVRQNKNSCHVERGRDISYCFSTDLILAQRSQRFTASHNSRLALIIRGLCALCVRCAIFESKVVLPRVIQ